MLLDKSGHEIVVNPFGRKLRAVDIAPFVRDAHAIIAGTEPLTAEIIEECPNLMVISRVGSGYDSVDLVAARKSGVVVTYAPEAPVASVVELVIALAIDGLRGIVESDRGIRAGNWTRPKGRLLAGRTVGIAGVGRIGTRVAGVLRSLGCHVLGHDILPNSTAPVDYVDKAELLSRSEILFIHLPLTPQTRNWLGQPELALMPRGAILVNAARGRIVDEAALGVALRSGHLARAAVDVFKDEPYSGPLAALPNITLTGHIGAMAQESRILMELEAVRAALAVLAGCKPDSEVPVA